MKKSLIHKKSIVYPLAMLSAMWLFFLLQDLGLFENCWGAIMPLTPEGLKGILFSPLLHGNLNHIFSNSVPIVVLMFLLYQFYPLVADRVFVWGWLATGLLVWMLPPVDVFTGEYHYSCIIGASGLVYVLAFFLFFSGIFRRTTTHLAISLVVVLYYGSLIWGMFPEELFTNLSEPSKISWQSHLAGAMVGAILALLLRKVGERKKKYIWEFPNYYSEKDDKLWQHYKETHPEDFMELPYKKEENIWSYLDEIRKKSSE